MYDINKYPKVGKNMSFTATLASYTAENTYLAKGFSKALAGVEPYKSYANLNTDEGSAVIDFYGLQEISEFSSAASASGGYDQIEVTTLADTRHQYVNGLIADDGGNNQITLKFVYDPIFFELLSNTADKVASGDTEGLESEYDVFELTIPGGGIFKITAQIAGVQMDTISTNSALTYTVTLNVSGIELSNTNLTV